MDENKQLEETKTTGEEKTIHDHDDKELQIASLHEKNLLLTAEIENRRKEYAKETEHALKYANKRVLLKILPLIENYKRALLFAEGSGNKAVESFVIGFEMILNDFKDSLKSEGVEEYSPQIHKEVWNSSFCEIVDEIENNEYQNGTVMQVVQCGYFLQGRLLSPAKIVISKKSKST